MMLQMLGALSLHAAQPRRAIELPSFRHSVRKISFLPRFGVGARSLQMLTYDAANRSAYPRETTSLSAYAARRRTGAYLRAASRSPASDIV